MFKATISTATTLILCARLADKIDETIKQSKSTNILEYLYMEHTFHFLKKQWESLKSLSNLQYYCDSRSPEENNIQFGFNIYLNVTLVRITEKEHLLFNCLAWCKRSTNVAAVIC